MPLKRRNHFFGEETHGRRCVVGGDQVEVDLQGGSVEPSDLCRVPGDLLTDVFRRAHPDRAAFEQRIEVGGTQIVKVPAVAGVGSNSGRI